MVSKMIKVYMVAFVIVMALILFVDAPETNADTDTTENETQDMCVITIEETRQINNIEPEPIAIADNLEIYMPAKEPEWGFDFDYICRVVAAESRGEPFEGQVAVARCIWNTAISRGISPEEVVEMPNRYADPVASSLVTESVREACMYAFLGMKLPTEEPIEYFYSTANGFVSNWHENALEHVITIGNHKFFKVVS